MTSTDYCDLCELPRSTCVHGMPPPPPEPAKKAPVRKVPARVPGTPMRVAAEPAAVKVATKPATKSTSAPRRTPQADFRPHLLAALQQHGGSLDAEQLMDELEERMTGVLRAADRETLTKGELRWHYAARLERKAMTDDGLMAPSRVPGTWELTTEGMQAVTG